MKYTWHVLRRLTLICQNLRSRAEVANDRELTCFDRGIRAAEFARICALTRVNSFLFSRQKTDLSPHL